MKQLQIIFALALVVSAGSALEDGNFYWWIPAFSLLPFAIALIVKNE